MNGCRLDYDTETGLSTGRAFVRVPDSDKARELIHKQFCDIDGRKVIVREMIEKSRADGGRPRLVYKNRQRGNDMDRDEQD